MQTDCQHFLQKKENISPNSKNCEECEKEHMPTVALRMCLTCGHVGCCDSSIGKHATKHFEESLSCRPSAQGLRGVSCGP